MTEIVDERPLIVGPEIVQNPYPIYLKGLVTKGFGRGSKDLGIPTANLPEVVAAEAQKVLKTGIYYGWASVGDDLQVYPMVMSYGWNPFYKNEKRSAEVHVIHKFETDFYDKELRVVVLEYIRPEKNYSSVDDLIKDINIDIDVAKSSLGRKSYSLFKEHEFLKT